MNTKFLWGTSNTKMLEITIPENSAHDDEGTKFFELDRWILQVLLYTVVRPAFWIWGEKTLFISFNVIYPQSLLGKKNVHCKPIPVMKTGFALCSFSHRENPVLALYWPCTGLQCGPNLCGVLRIPKLYRIYFSFQLTTKIQTEYGASSVGNLCYEDRALFILTGL